MNFDIKITNGKVIDGAGNPWFYSDLIINNGRIQKIGESKNLTAKKNIDASGLAVAPGFIDIHNHTDHTILTNNKAESMMRQGVTTVTVGNCGYSMAPITKKHKEDVKKHLAPFLMSKLSWDWYSLGEFMAKLEKNKISINMAHLVGHGTIRVAVMGFDDREPSKNEIHEMKQLVSQSMEDGAFGISSGLGYPPASFAKTDELIELCKVVSKYNGLYTTHMRNRMPQNFEEAIETGVKGRVPVQISHIGSMTARANKNDVIKIIENAREEGLDITSDIYPYAAGSSFLSSIFPSWMHEGGTDGFIKRIKDVKIREQLRDEYEGRDWNNIMLSFLPSEANKHLEGKTVKEIAQIKSQDPIDALCEILIAEKGEGMYVSFFGEENELYILMKHSTTMFGSDGWAYANYGPLSRGKPHPRCYGTFPKIISKYIQEGILTLEEAIRKITSFPAQRLGIKDRGVLKEGMWADIVIFDPINVKDKSTFTEPHQYPEGILYVIVNGNIVIYENEYTGALPGKVLRRTGS